MEHLRGLKNGKIVHLRAEKRKDSTSGAEKRKDSTSGAEKRKDSTSGAEKRKDSTSEAEKRKMLYKLIEENHV